MTAFILNITFECRDPLSLGQFWAQLTGYTVDPEADETRVRLTHPDDRGVRHLLFLRVETPRVDTRMHVDLAARDPDAEIERLVGAGATPRRSARQQRDADLARDRREAVGGAARPRGKRILPRLAAREAQREPGSLVGGRLELDAAAVGFRDLTHDGEPEARPAGDARRGLVASPEALKDT